MTFASQRTEPSNLSSFSTSDRFDYVSILSKLRRLSDININPINKKKTSDYTSDNNADVTIFKLPKRTDKIQEAREKNNSRQDERIDEVAKNYKSDIMKIIGQINHTLSKFKMKMHRLELDHLKNEIVNQYHAEHILFIIGCNIRKLKKELKGQEELLTMFCHRQSVQPKSKKLPFYKFGKLNPNNKDNSQSQSEITQGRRSLDDATEMNNANCMWNDHVSIGTTYQRNHENLAFEESYISTETILRVNEKIALWQKQNRASNLSELTENANWKRSARIGSISASERIVPDQYPTKTKKNSLGNKLTSKKVQCARSSNNRNIYNTYSTVPFFPIKNNDVLKARKVDKDIRIFENESKFYHRLKSSFSRTRLLGTHNVDEPQATNLRSYNSQEIIIIPQNTEHETSTCNEGNKQSIYSARCSTADLEVESVNSSISSTFSAYIVPTVSHNTKNGDSSAINPATITSNGGIMDKKIFMTCEVVLDKLQV
ncbi:uncharacterized protein LOC143212955 [Lasioglossum baleicum]|uniref:uncharacterized protein LOC143212955 n=1 Tax=Lasioglossum baleicum TaxID=434251 RepID=UPI003FCE62D3